MSLKMLLKNNGATDEVAKEITEQIEVCRDLCRPLPLGKIEELCKLTTPIQVQIALHDWKFN